MKHQAYFTRALQARNPRFAQIFEKLGYRTTDLVAADDSAPDIQELRDLYEQLVGKRPYMRWDAETLTKKIAEKRSAA